VQRRMHAAVSCCANIMFTRCKHTVYTKCGPVGLGARMRRHVSAGSLHFCSRVQGTHCTSINIMCNPVCCMGGRCTGLCPALSICVGPFELHRAPYSFSQSQFVPGNLEVRTLCCRGSVRGLCCTVTCADLGIVWCFLSP
jgi:hypothetical protein